MEVTHSPALREVLIVSGVSILNDCVFSMLRSKIGHHRFWVPEITGCKNPGTVDSEPILQHFCLTADAMPPTGSCSCEDLHSSLLLWVFLSDWARTGREVYNLL